VADPFGSDPAARLYKSGDLARWLGGGELEHLGRKDHQVQLRGFRVELSEIEIALLQCPGVGDAAVVLREYITGDPRLAAYVVAQRGRTLRVPDLRRHVKQTLPEYMIPSSFILMDALPLTANGKLDRKALPAPAGERPLDETYVPPRTETERQIVDIWRDVLQIEKIGVHDSFFELGGHSLLAIRLMSQLRDVFSLSLPLTTIFDYPTAASLATYVDAVRCLGAGKEGPAPDDTEARERGEV
jgi:acyl carrier protein